MITFLSMTNNRSITRERYTSAILSYACTLSKKRCIAIRELPPDTLAGLGIGVEHDRYNAASIRVRVVPEDLEKKGVRVFVEALEGFVKRNKGMEPPKPEKKKRGRGRPKKKAPEFQKTAVLEENINLGCTAKPNQVA
jgi:hypothetical protein